TPFESKACTATARSPRGITTTADDQPDAASRASGRAISSNARVVICAARAPAGAPQSTAAATAARTSTRLDMRQRLRIDPVLRGGQAGARRVATEVEVQSDSSATRDPSIAEKHAPVWALMARASIRAAVRLAGRIRAGLAALLRLLFFLF